MRIVHRNNIISAQLKNFARVFLTTFGAQFMKRGEINPYVGSNSRKLSPLPLLENGSIS